MWFIKISLMLIAAGSAVAMFEDDDFFKGFNSDKKDSFSSSFSGFSSGRSGGRSGGSFFERDPFGDDDSDFNIFGGSFFGSKPKATKAPATKAPATKPPVTKPPVTKATKPNTKATAPTTAATKASVTATPTPRPEPTNRPIQRQPVTKSQVAQAKAAIRGLVDRHSGKNNTKPFNAALLRNSFHDCVGPLGCDGCINHHNEANEGLRRATDPLDELFESQFYEIFTRSDFYALAGITAAEYAASLADCKGQGCIPQIKFQFGRLDCNNRLNFSHSFCPFHDDPQEFLTSHFKLTQEEVVAIMGAHSIGRINRVDGDAWDDTPDALDIDYYKQLLEHDWKQAGATLRPSKDMAESWVRVDNNKLMMLGSDIFLVSNINKAFIPTCSQKPLNCPESDLRKFVERFAKDQKYFISKFASAYQKVIETGNWTLRDVVDG